MDSEKEHKPNLAQKLIIRDYLAEERTVLANRRTLLAYLRTSLAYFVAGASLIRFFTHPAFSVVGWVFIPSAAVIMAAGFVHYRRMNKFIKDTVDKPGEEKLL